MQTMILVWIYLFSAEHNLDPVLVEAIVRQEAGYSKVERGTYDYRAIGSIGEIGLMQMRKEYLENPTKYLDPKLNLKEGTKRLAKLKKLQSELGPFWFTAWNLGETGSLKFHKAKGITKAPYAKKVLKHYYSIKQELKKNPSDIRHSLSFNKKTNFPMVIAHNNERQ